MQKEEIKEEQKNKKYRRCIENILIDGCCKPNYTHNSINIKICMDETSQSKVRDFRGGKQKHNPTIYCLHRHILESKIQADSKEKDGEKGIACKQQPQGSWTGYTSIR